MSNSQSLNGLVITKTSKRNLHRKLQRYAKKAKLEEEKTMIMNEKPITTDICKYKCDDNNEDEDKEGENKGDNNEIFYNPNKVS